MKVVILAGGYGTRISEESYYRPKPMVEIGGKPILWHIMKEYSHYGFREFVICAGYKQQVIKEWFANYFLNNSDVTFDFTKDDNTVTYHQNVVEPWKVSVVYTGLDTMTGGRIKRARSYIGDEPFMLTYGDGVSDVNLKELLSFHKEHGKIATLTAVHVDERFGVLEIDRDDMSVGAFREKSIADGSRINAGYMVLEPEIFDYLKDDRTVFEQEVMQKLVRDGQLCAYKHNGFWQCMDTKREMNALNAMIDAGTAPWMTWV